MMNRIFVLVVLASVLLAAWSGRMSELTNDGIIRSAGNAVELAIGLVGVMALFIGLITGFPLIIEAIVLAIIIGATISLLLLVLGVRGLRDHVPYGPFLVAGAIVTLLWGYPIANWFLNR